MHLFMGALQQHLVTAAITNNLHLKRNAVNLILMTLKRQRENLFKRRHTSLILERQEFSV